MPMAHVVYGSTSHLSGRQSEMKTLKGGPKRKHPTTREDRKAARRRQSKQERQAAKHEIALAPRKQ
jgi:hypothetical protein